MCRNILIAIVLIFTIMLTANVSARHCHHRWVCKRPCCRTTCPTLVTSYYKTYLDPIRYVREGVTIGPAIYLGHTTVAPAEFLDCPSRGKELKRATSCGCLHKFRY